MRVLILDAETYYSKEYSFRVMDPPSYILDPQFELIGFAVKEPGTAARWVEGPQAAAFFASLDPKDTITVSHNALFDNAIWAWRYGFVPRLMVDTLGMSRAVLNLKSYSLKAVAEHFKLPAKGEEIHKAIGLRRADLMADKMFWPAYTAYACHDATLCAAIFQKLLPHFPPEELLIQNYVLRTAVTPVLRADKELLTRHLADLRARKAELLNACGYEKAALMSATQFCQALERLGVTVATKISPTDKEIPALARTDQFMADLAEYSAADEETNFKVQTLVQARLSHKSTIEETRSERFLHIASLPWPNGQPMLPIPLRYAGAHTHRLSGEWKMNCQNMPRDRAKSQLRTALVAPPGKLLVVADLAQIEARIVAVLCGEQALVKQFRQGVDVYAEFATRVFSRPVDKHRQPAERFIGKTGILGLGYGCGKDRFYQMVTQQARTFGIKLDGLFDLGMATFTVKTYRSMFTGIPAMWRDLDRAKALVLNTDSDSNAATLPPIGPVTIRSKRIELPNKLFLRYTNEQITDLWGGKILENIVQALARIVLMQAALRLAEQGLRFVLQAHDELVFAVPIDRVKLACKFINDEMIKSPSWMPDLPLAVEIGQGETYGEAKT